MNLSKNTLINFIHVNKTQTVNEAGVRSTVKKRIWGATNEGQGFGFHKSPWEPGVSQPLPLRKEESTGPRGTQSRVNGNSRSRSSPSACGAEEAGLWTRSKPSIEGNFQRK